MSGSEVVLAWRWDRVEVRRSCDGAAWCEDVAELW